MKKSNVYVAALTVVAAGVLWTSCKKDLNQSDSSARALSALTYVIAPGTTLSGVINAANDPTGVIRDTFTLAAGTYFLNGLVYVDSLDVIKIAAGAIIKGNPGSGGAPGGGLIITRGGKIEATGTSTNPVVFTSSSATPVAGSWSGLVILGQAPTNKGDTGRVEGVPPAAPADVTYGGSVAGDNSGILNYVRIEYAGYELSTDNELNGLTLAGVGSGTTIDFVEIYKAADDGIEFFGGTVNATHIVIVNQLDDALDFDNGYKGNIQYALVVEDTTRADKSGSNAIESDNNATGTVVSGQPITHPKIANLTIIGLPNQAKSVATNLPPAGVAGSRYQNANQWRRASEFEVYNSAFLGFNTGILLDNALATPSTEQVQTKFNSGISILNGNLIHAYTTPFATAAPSSTFTATGNKGFTTVNPNDSIKLISPFSRTTTNFFLPFRNALTPSANSMALTGGVTVPAGLTTTTYRGAFNNTGSAADNWTTGWTVFNY